jgi:meiotically up-regulated gene 157 (Mug157) protein
MLGSCFVVFSTWLLAGLDAKSLPNQRPDYEKRTYHSSAIDNMIDSLKPLFLSEDVATIFANALPNTLDTTVSYSTPNPSQVSHGELDSFVITGDIDALWLRDSMNQVIPYIPYSAEDTELQYLLEGLINRHAKSVLIDPFANAFNFNASKDGHKSDIRTPPMTAQVFEGKYEIDSLAAFLKLSYWYWYYAGDAALVRFVDSTWLSAAQTTLSTGKGESVFLFSFVYILGTHIFSYSSGNYAE